MTLSTDWFPKAAESEVGFKEWKSWAKLAVEERRHHCLVTEGGPKDEATRVSTWRALVAHFSDLTISPEDAVPAAQAFFEKAADAPSPIARAAELLLQRSMLVGATSPDVLFLAAAFTWPLRYVFADTSKVAEQYLVYAPWQISTETYRAFANSWLKVQSPGPLLTDIAERRVEAELPVSARELLEGLVLASCRLDTLAKITSLESLNPIAGFPDGERGIIRLARRLVEEGNAEVQAREVIRKAASIDTATSDLKKVVAERVWNRPLVEAYAWGENKGADDLGQEITLAIKAHQPDHARRLAEAMVARHLDRWYVGKVEGNVRGGLAAFAATPVESTDKLARQVRTATEQLAMLYSRTGYATPEAFSLVGRVLKDPRYIGDDAHLKTVTPELNRFLTRWDPHIILTRQEDEFRAARVGLRDGEKAALDQVHAWFDQRSMGAAGVSVVEKVVRTVTTPLVSLAGWVSAEVPGLADVIDASMRTAIAGAGILAGDLSDIASEGARLRAESGCSAALMDRARQITDLERFGAAVLSGMTAFLPPGFRLAGSAADLGVSLLVAYRIVARVGALFGRPMSGPEGAAFVSDAFNLGVSSAGNAGLVSFLTRQRQDPVSAVTVGGVAYGATRLAGHLWTAEGQTSAALSGQLIANASRLLSLTLSEAQVAKVLPVVGALLSGMTTLAFLNGIRDAAVHIAARDALILPGSSK